MFKTHCNPIRLEYLLGTNKKKKNTFFRRSVLRTCSPASPRTKRRWQGNNARRTFDGRSAGAGRKEAEDAVHHRGNIETYDGGNASTATAVSVRFARRRRVHVWSDQQRCFCSFLRRCATTAIHVSATP